MECSNDLHLWSGKMITPRDLGAPMPFREVAQGQLLLLQSARGRWLPGAGPSTLVGLGPLLWLAQPCPAHTGTNREAEAA